MKNLKLLSILMGMMLFFISCSIEPNEDIDLEVTNLKTSNDDACETGFAICAESISTCFLDSGFNRWGWTIGSVSPWGGTHTYQIFAGAGQCDTSKGKLAGTVTLKYEAGVAMVKFIANEGYVFKETHLYVGDTPYPMKKQGKKVVPTVAPGQYPYKHGDLEKAMLDCSREVDVHMGTSFVSIWMVWSGCIVCSSSSIYVNFYGHNH